MPVAAAASASPGVGAGFGATMADLDSRRFIALCAMSAVIAAICSGCIPVNTELAVRQACMSPIERSLEWTIWPGNVGTLTARFGKIGW